MDFSIITSNYALFLQGIWQTLSLVILSLAIGLLLAIPIGYSRAFGRKSWATIGYVYCYIFRGTPLLVQIYLIYYASPRIGWIRDSFLWEAFKEPFFCAVVAFSLNTAAYTAEIIRGALLAVPKGEIEAGKAIGMGPWLIARRILAPHVVRMALPAYSNEIILVLKGSALASTITLMDIMGVARQLNAQYASPYEVFLVAGMIYLGLTLILTRLLKRLEKKASPRIWV